MKKIDLKTFPREELDEFIAEIGEKPFRASQLWSWIYQKGLTSFDGMTNISRNLRTKLNRIALISALKLVEKKVSPVSETTKFLWELEDGLKIESVYIPEKKRRTICISSQVGCSLGCSFCATGAMGFFRNLMPHEIVNQVLSTRQAVGERLTNIVVMGMGEPFLNYDNVMRALMIISDPEGIAISRRKITISTAGIVPQIYRYTEEKRPFKLAISLNATTNAQRNKLMPINRKYPLEELIKAARFYTRKLKRRVTFEYVLIKNINDTPGDAERLLKLLKGIPCKVNLIPYNSTYKKYSRPDNERIRIFADSIRQLYAPVTLRLSRGDDINGACGQLAVST